MRKRRKYETLVSSYSMLGRIIDSLIFLKPNLGNSKIRDWGAAVYTLELMADVVYKEQSPAKLNAEVKRLGFASFDDLVDEMINVLTRNIEKFEYSIHDLNSILDSYEV